VAQKLQMHSIPAPACLWALPHHPAHMSVPVWAADFFASFAHPSLTRFSKLQWAYHEYVGYIWYQFLGRI
jgi:hypothetical protein